MQTQQCNQGLFNIKHHYYFIVWETICDGADPKSEDVEAAISAAYPDYSEEIRLLALYYRKCYYTEEGISDRILYEIYSHNENISKLLETALSTIDKEE